MPIPTSPWCISHTWLHLHVVPRGCFLSSAGKVAAKRPLLPFLVSSQGCVCRGDVFKVKKLRWQGRFRSEVFL